MNEQTTSLAEMPPPPPPVRNKSSNDDIDSKLDITSLLPNSKKPLAPAQSDSYSYSHIQHSDSLIPTDTIDASSSVRRNDGRRNSIGNTQEGPPRRKSSATLSEISRTSRSLLADVELSEPFVQSSLTGAKYSVMKTLGSGTFSIVKLCQREGNGEQVAIKFIPQALINRQPELMRLMREENNLMQSLDHENIVKLLETFEYQGYSCIVMEYVDGGDLFDYMALHPNGISESMAKDLFKQIMNGLKCVHEHNIAHRDLKLENILCVKPKTSGILPQLKMADFGLAVRIDPTGTNLLTNRCGSEEYAAPEIIRGEPYNGKASDIWAAGIVLFALVTGGLPFNRDPLRPRSMFHRIALGQFSFPADLELSREVCDLIRGILNPIWQRRLTEDEILNHSWFLKNQ